MPSRVPPLARSTVIMFAVHVNGVDAAPVEQAAGQLVHRPLPGDLPSDRIVLMAGAGDAPVDLIADHPWAARRPLHNSHRLSHTPRDRIRLPPTRTVNQKGRAVLGPIRRWDHPWVSMKAQERRCRGVGPWAERAVRWRGQG